MMSGRSKSVGEAMSLRERSVPFLKLFTWPWRTFSPIEVDLRNDGGINLFTPSLLPTDQPLLVQVFEPVVPGRSLYPFLSVQRRARHFRTVDDGDKGGLL